ncbi:Zinc finger HIT domain-containing protein 2 [Leucoagaricus sp. SymC.cos]|nr:Zinc finger HIT domain-containing protein 2 [Leucoagaricus sp. SymC.cos]
MSTQEIQTPSTATSQDEADANKTICRFCRRQFAKYTCPTCNVPYCSLTCFRSSAHSQCSETFYKNELQTDIAMTPSRTAEERKQMMELLKRFEDEAATEEDALNRGALAGSGSENEDENKGESLIEKFAELDLDSLTSEEMWEMLTSEERTKFMRGLEDPTSELAQRLLGSAQLDVEIEQPWWTDDIESVDFESRTQGGNERRKAKLRPRPIRISRSMIKPVPQGHPLVYNMTAICIQHRIQLHSTPSRQLSTLAPMSPDSREARRLMDLLVPFLSDRRSTILLSNVEAATTDVYSRFEMGQVNSELLAVLLEDTATLMKPLRIVSVSSVPSQSAESEDPAYVDLSAHPLLVPILVISDLDGFFQHGRYETGTFAIKPKSIKFHPYQHIIRKLEFYVAHILSMPYGIMEAVSQEVLRWSQKVRAEGQSIVSKSPVGVGRVRDSQRRLVEEVG